MVAAAFKLGLTASIIRTYVWNPSQRDRRGSPGVASTARGFVWNARNVGAEDVTARQLQPHEGSSGTPSRRQRRLTAQGFNRTRVRLERRTSRSPRRSISFNRTRARLERLRGPRDGPDGRASTARGFVWNQESLPQTGQPSSLQPHEGSSGTISPLSFLQSLRLQPHEGSSGTSPRSSMTVPRSALQPHEGSSGTTSPQNNVVQWTPLQPHEGSSGTRRKSRRAGLSRVASTARGFVWNEYLHGR